MELIQPQMEGVLTVLSVQCASVISKLNLHLHTQSSMSSMTLSSLCTAELPCKNSVPREYQGDRNGIHYISKIRKY